MGSFIKKMSLYLHFKELRTNITNKNLFLHSPVNHLDGFALVGLYLVATA